MGPAAVAQTMEQPIELEPVEQLAVPGVEQGPVEPVVEQGPVEPAVE